MCSCQNKPQTSIQGYAPQPARRSGGYSAAPTASETSQGYSAPNELYGAGSSINTRIDPQTPFVPTPLEAVGITSFQEEIFRAIVGNKKVRVIRITHPRDY